jgi:DNA-binding transcriptional ArsR family regulator
MATDRLSAIFAALADPTRRAILARLTKGEATVNELAAPFSISLPAVSRHLKVLEAAGLISRSRSAQWRSSRLAVDGLREATEWMEPYRRFWDASFERLDAHLQQVQHGQHQPDRPPASRRGPNERNPR